MCANYVSAAHVSIGTSRRVRNVKRYISALRTKLLRRAGGGWFIGESRVW